MKNYKKTIGVKSKLKVHELIELLKKQPQYADVKTDDGKYVQDPTRVELDDRNYVIIRVD